MIDVYVRFGNKASSCANGFRRGLDKSEVENVRACMGDTVVGQLRFLALSPEEFCKGPAKSGLLTRDECYAVFMNMAIPGIVALPKGEIPRVKVQRMLSIGTPVLI